MTIGLPLAAASKQRSRNSFAAVGRQTDDMRLSQNLRHVVVPTKQFDHAFLLPLLQQIGRHACRIPGIALAYQGKSRLNAACFKHASRFNKLSHAFVEQEPRRQNHQRRSRAAPGSDENFRRQRRSRA